MECSQRGLWASTFTLQNRETIHTLLLQFRIQDLNEVEFQIISLKVC